MLLRFLLLVQLQIIIILQLTAAHPLPLDEQEDLAHTSSHLRLTARRLAKIQQDVEPRYAAELQQLRAHYLLAGDASVDDVQREAQLIDAYEAQLSDDFLSYVHQRLDEQFLNEDIRIQEWGLRQLMTQVDVDLVRDIAALLPHYERALATVDFDEKYNYYADIQERFTPALQAYIDQVPEDAAMLNVQLQFDHELLLHLQAQDNGYAAEIEDALSVLELALKDTSVEPKLRVLERFDDVSTPFGRYMNNEVWDFEFERFGG